MEIHGKLVDVRAGEIRSSAVAIEKGTIVEINPNSHRGEGFLLPGFVDVRLPLAGTFLPPHELARLVLRHGTLAMQVERVEIEEGVGKDFFFASKCLTPLSFSMGPTFSTYATLSEAREGVEQGEVILVTESNLPTLFPLLSEEEATCVFASDCVGTDQLLLGHINLLVRDAVSLGLDPLKAIEIGSVAGVDAFDLEAGTLKVGDPADLIVVDDLESFRVKTVYIRGEAIFKDKVLIPNVEGPFLPAPSFEVEVVDAACLATGAIAFSTGKRILAFGSAGMGCDKVVDAVLKVGGGFAIESGGQLDLLPFPIGGVFSDMEGEVLARKISDFTDTIRSFGIHAPHPIPFLLSHSP